MITEIRRSLKTRGFRTALWVFIIGIAGGGILLQFFINLFDKAEWALKVNGTVISKEEFGQKMVIENDFIRTIKNYLGPQADMYLKLYGLDKDLGDLAKEHLIRAQLLNNQVKKMGFAVSPKYIIEKINDPEFVSTYLADVIPLSVFVQGRGIDPSRLYNELRQLNLTEADFEKQISAAIKRYILLDQLLSPVAYVPEFAQAYEQRMLYSPRVISYAKIAYEDELAKAKKEAVSLEDLQLFFDRENRKKKRYLVPEKRSGVIWRFDASKYGIAIPEKRVQEYYQRHKSDFLKERAKVHVRHILFRVDAPQDDERVYAKAQEVLEQVKGNPELFEDLAQQYSADSKTASKGGLLDPFSKGEYGNVPFEKAAFLLTRDGDISSLVRTKEGYEILQRVERIPQTYKSFEQVKDDIKALLEQKKFEQHFVSDVRAMIRNGLIDNQKWQEFTKEKSATTQRLSDKAENPADRSASALFKGKKGKYTPYLDGQVGVVVRLEDIETAHIPILNTLTSEVTADLQEERATKNVDKLAKQLRKEAIKDSLGSVAQGHKLSIKQVTINPMNQQQIRELDQQGLPLAQMLQLENIGSISKGISGQDGYLIRLDSLEVSDGAEVEEQAKAKLDQRMLQENSSYITASYIASLYRDATIKVNHSLLNNLL